MATCRLRGLIWASLRLHQFEVAAPERFGLLRGVGPDEALMPALGVLTGDDEGANRPRRLVENALTSALALDLSGRDYSGILHRRIASMLDFGHGGALQREIWSALPS